MKKKIIIFVSYLIIFIGVFIIIFSFLPWYPKILSVLPIKLSLNEQNVPDQNIIPDLDYQDGLTDHDSSTTTATTATSTAVVATPDIIPISINHLVIPAIGVNIQVISSDNQEYALNSGAWHMPDTGTPNNLEGKKNIVIAGHRFLYTSGPKTFYNLDKLKPGDLIMLYWSGQEYKYMVDKNYIVQPEEVSILDNTSQEKLTLFTCNPVYSSKERLVIDAYPIYE